MGIRQWLQAADLEERQETRRVAITDDTFLSPGLASELALHLPTVYRCLDIVSNDVASMPVKAWHQLREEHVETPRVLRRPDPFTTRQEFIRLSIVDLLVLGNCYWQKAASGEDGFATALRRIPANLVNVNWDSSLGNTQAQIVGSKSYKVNGVPTDAAEIVHTQLITYPGNPRGLGVLEALWGTIDGALAAEAMVRSTFQDGVFPTGIIENPTTLSKQGADRLKSQFTERNRGSREPVVMSGGATYNVTQTTMRDQQWIESRQLSAVEICRAFGVPASMVSAPLLGGSAGLNYSNDRTQRVSLLHSGLAPVMSRLESSLTLATLPSTTEAYIDATRFLAGLPATGEAPDVLFGQPTDPRTSRVEAQEATADEPADEPVV